MTLSLITQKNYSNILSTYLNVLDTDPAYDMVEGLLADIISAKNASQWLIGDLLVFLRFRTDYQTIKIFNWSGAYSKELVDFIRDEYRVDLDLETKDRQEFLQWEVVKFPKFWLLIEPDEVKV